MGEKSLSRFISSTNNLWQGWRIHAYAHCLQNIQSAHFYGGHNRITIPTTEHWTASIVRKQCELISSKKKEDPFFSLHSSFHPNIIIIIHWHRVNASIYFILINYYIIGDSLVLFFWIFSQFAFILYFVFRCNWRFVLMFASTQIHKWTFWWCKQ